MDNDITLNTAAGQFFIAGQSYTLTDFMMGVGEILATVRETGNWQMYGNTVKSMVGFSNATGKALACLTAGGKSIWTEKGGTERDFYAMVEVQSGVSRQTLERYSEAWQAVELVPEEHRDDMLKQPMKSLVMLGSAIEQGITPDRDAWKSLTEAQSFHDFAAILHDEGLPSRKSWTRLLFDEVSGDIYVQTENGKEFVGWLDVGNSEHSDPIKKAIKRITRSSGMKLQQGE